MKTSITNSNGLAIEIGKTYYFYCIGMDEVMTHTVKSLDCVYATASDGRVELDSLYENPNDIQKQN